MQLPSQSLPGDLGDLVPGALMDTLELNMVFTNTDKRSPITDGTKMMINCDNQSTDNKIKNNTEEVNEVSIFCIILSLTGSNTKQLIFLHQFSDQRVAGSIPDPAANMSKCP